MALVKKLKMRSCQDLALRDGYFRAPREGLIKNPIVQKLTHIFPFATLAELGHADNFVRQLRETCF